VEPPAPYNLSKPVILESIAPRHRKQKRRPVSEKVVDEEDKEDKNDDEDDRTFIFQDEEDPEEDSEYELDSSPVKQVKTR
jgi:hypothetical protein